MHRQNVGQNELLSNKHHHDSLQTYITIIQSVPVGMDKTSGECPYVELYRYNPKHLHPKLNGYGDNGQRSLKL